MTPEQIREWAWVIVCISFSAFVFILVACVGFDLMRDRWRRK